MKKLTSFASEENGGLMMKDKVSPIDAKALMAFARNNVSRSVDCNDIARFPRIDPETLRPKGRWEYYSSTMQECSVCKRHTARHKYDYCPRCGADMRGDSDAD